MTNNLSLHFDSTDNTKSYSKFIDKSVRDTGISYMCTKFGSHEQQKLPERYKKCKEIVINAGFKGEIIWQDSVKLSQLTERVFLQEYAWVTLSSGMREQVVRNIFERLAKVFFNWKSAKIISENVIACRQSALEIFGNKNKINAILTTSHIISEFEFPRFKKLIMTNPYETLSELPYIGPITYFHLAKNIGIQVAKPDRHLSRLADILGFQNAQELCSFISVKTGDSIPVIDIVLWRYANITKDAPINFLEMTV